ncbi:hypothetical protein, partial [Nonomuraea sp. LPB2021202275-12-8]|uniref:hypothetical protein n=1 Tax=Nonomuraea sp. LPB2021202275-12-8 TaxID=3120159 RepID=UPI00300C2E74
AGAMSCSPPGIALAVLFQRAELVNDSMGKQVAASYSRLHKSAEVSLVEVVGVPDIETRVGQFCTDEVRNTGDLWTTRWAEARGTDDLLQGPIPSGQDQAIDVTQAGRRPSPVHRHLCRSVQYLTRRSSGTPLR